MNHLATSADTSFSVEILLLVHLFELKPDYKIENLSVMAGFFKN